MTPRSLFVLGILTMLAGLVAVGRYVATGPGLQEGENSVGIGGVLVLVVGVALVKAAVDQKGRIR